MLTVIAVLMIIFFIPIWIAIGIPMVALIGAIFDSKCPDGFSIIFFATVWPLLAIVIAFASIFMAIGKIFSNIGIIKRYHNYMFEKFLNLKAKISED